MGTASQSRPWGRTAVPLAQVSICQMNHCVSCRPRTAAGVFPGLSSRIKRNASADELVRCAVDAATAYENILNAIKAAEDAADKATTASESALQVGHLHGHLF